MLTMGRQAKSGKDMIRLTVPPSDQPTEIDVFLVSVKPGGGKLGFRMEDKVHCLRGELLNKAVETVARREQPKPQQRISIPVATGPAVTHPGLMKKHDRKPATSLGEERND